MVVDSATPVRYSAQPSSNGSGDSMKKMTLGSLLFTLMVVLTTLTAKAGIVPPAGLTTDDQFRLIFVSSND